MARALALSVALVSLGAANASRASRRPSTNRPRTRRARPRSAAPIDREGAHAQRRDRAESKNGGRTATRPRRLGRKRRRRLARRQRPPASAPAAGGKKVTSKTYTFGAMDVEGKLKTPQLLYFLNRVKLELDMSAPDKRSFMKELQQSADDKNL